MQLPTNLRSFLQTLPKIDLHRHLEGSLRLSTLAELARQNGVDMESLGIEELRPLVQMMDDEPNFQEFLAKFAVLRRFYSTPEAIARIASEAVADAVNDNIKYLELRFNPVALAFHQGFSFEEVADWVIAAVNDAQTKLDIQVKLIVQMGRHEPQFAWQLAKLAVARQDQGIVGLDLAGDEQHFTAEKFIDVMNWAKEQGLYITAHAGECNKCPAANVREAVEIIKADRIGHGVQSMRNPDIIELLARRNIALEMCPTSNLQTGAITGLYEHPLLSFFKRGVPVTINTDDPSISNITLTDEYMVATRVLGVSMETLKMMILNAARSAFLPPIERDALVNQFSDMLDAHLAEAGS